MTQLVEAVGWLVLSIATVLALILVAVLCSNVFGSSSTDPHGFALVLPIIGLILFALPGMLAGWGLIRHAQRQRAYRKAI